MSKSRCFATKVYAYYPVSSLLAHMMRREGFTHKMEHWRNRPTRSNTLFDVYDGRMWKSVPDPRSTASNHILFVDTPFSLLLTLNIDCSNYSTRRTRTLLVLSTYMTVNNLPRTERAGHYAYSYGGLRSARGTWNVNASVAQISWEWARDFAVDIGYFASQYTATLEKHVT